VAMSVLLSKTFSYVLRHVAQQEGIPIKPDGYVKISDRLLNDLLKEVVLEKILEVVGSNDNKRFEVIPSGNDVLI